MKKIAVLLLSLILSAGMLVGCGESANTAQAGSAEELMKKMQTKATEATYVEANMNMDFTMAMTGVEVPMKIETKIKSDSNNNVLVDMNMAYSMLGQESTQSQSIYLTDGNLYMKTEGIDWTQAVGADASSMGQYSNQITSVADFNSNVKYTLGNEEDVNGVKAKKVTGELSGEDVKTLLNDYMGSITQSLGQVINLEGIDFSKMAVVAEYWITSDGDLVKYHMDMSDIMNEVMKAIMSGEMSSVANGTTIDVSKMDITMTDIKLDKTGNVAAPSDFKTSTI